MYPSKRCYSRRAFVSFWKPFVRVFQVLCISHYSTFYASGSVYRFIYYIVFSTMHIALLFYTFFNELHIQMKPNSDHRSSALMVYVNSASVIGSFVTHTVSHLEPLFSRKDEDKIYRKLNDINETFATKLNYVTDFKIIRRKFIWHTMVFFIFSASVSFINSIYSMPMTHTFDQVMYIITRLLACIISRARKCQIAFHINMMSNILLDLQILLKRQQKNYRPNSAQLTESSCDNIRYLRDIYSNVWLLRNLISNCFGWSFIAFLMEFVFDVINSSYWLYMNVKIYESTRMIIRKIFFQFQFILVNLLNIFLFY